MNLAKLIASKQAQAPAVPASPSVNQTTSDSAAKPKLGGLKPPSDKPRLGVKLGSLPTQPKVEKPVSTQVDDDMDLSALAGLDVSGIESIEEPSQKSEFPDEILADAPTRELPAEMTGQMVQFVESLDVIYTVLHDPDMLAQAIRSVMQELQENKEFIKLVADQDVHTMIKAIRQVMGVAKIRKEEKKAKTPGTRSKRTAASKYDADVMNQLDAMFAGVSDD